MTEKQAEKVIALQSGRRAYLTMRISCLLTFEYEPSAPMQKSNRTGTVSAVGEPFSGEDFWNVATLPSKSAVESL